MSRKNFTNIFGVAMLKFLQNFPHFILVYFIFRLFQLQSEKLDTEKEFTMNQYWLKLNRNRYNDNRDLKSAKTAKGRR